ncbi:MULTISPECIES: cytidine deaminase [unclassified Paenibacillus]|uniref:cytidine deaminase n=1 Tax=unclassified Paenibacillus TaxID=185978 RepID=UPI002404D764|nr:MULTISPECIES: cytidine deaminase [unclassified Paenibacillus]MDF9843612.1 cytidine deaminase [Paenibacillus sp. PastF-2]MDF9850201.1 cytidine deaminase [Paenibacillus sp. PastM-2]MDF9856859.1 cytidine deaminase [Paenibacillus sp. PastF-1]MDH6482048.1 cytidine deaminase [Paenibacillus sp. PastH-2]MDH6509472.1 cytidine deaminase [Paenibacillus sp. PastM-3]
MKYSISIEDETLVAAAQEIITKRYEWERHHVSAALRTRTGEIFTAVHLEASLSRVTVCAEAMVIGKAISEGYKAFDTIVAVRHPDPDSEDREIRVVSPCGMCRELIADYASDCKVILPGDEGLAKADILDLLPLRYSRK